MSSRLIIDDLSHCIMVPSANGVLEWRTPRECVWEDTEFSENGLQLRSKLAMEPLVERHAPEIRQFFTNILKLPDAGIDELLEDLQMLWLENSDDVMLVFRLYERIQTRRRIQSASVKIKYVRL
jgi:hypothetical protein